LDDTIRGNGTLTAGGATIPVRFELVSRSVVGARKVAVEGVLSGERASIDAAIAAQTGVLETASGVQMPIKLFSGREPGLAKFTMRQKD
jgi:hypothetical protein